MFIGITNEPRDYAWGSTSAIAELLGRTPSGGPEAELWFGAHPSAPSTVTAATPRLQGTDLAALIAADPEGMLGAGRDGLPFLMKVLAADAPLSLQVHPDAEQAREGYRREREAGTPADQANYVDENPKPELILALSATFEALAGFRHVSETRLLVAELAIFATSEDRPVITALGARLAAGDPEQAGSTGSARDVIAHGVGPADTVPDSGGVGNPLADTVTWLLHRGTEVDRLVEAVTTAAARASASSSFAREWATVTDLAEAYPGDPGVVLSMLLNRISLAQGQVLALPAGTVHAYLRGLGIEVMAASDNVLRGGLTAKRVDVEELLHIVRFEALPSALVRPVEPAPGVRVFRPETDHFELLEVAIGDAGAVHGYRLSGPDEVRVTLTGPAIVLCLTGGLALHGAKDTISLARGDAAYVTPDEGELVFTGSAVAVVATTPS